MTLTIGEVFLVATTISAVFCATVAERKARRMTAIAEQSLQVAKSTVSIVSSADAKLAELHRYLNTEGEGTKLFNAWEQKRRGEQPAA